jgi:sulfate/thiosulfate transport system permease protein
MREAAPRSPIQIAILAAVLLYAGALLIAPVAAIVQGAFGKGITTLVSAITEPDVLRAFELSFALAVGAVLINAVAGVIVAWVLARHNFPGKRLVNALVDAPFVFSPVIAGYVLIVLFGRNGWIAPTTFQIAFSWPGMLLATVFVSLPFVAREVGPVLAALTPEQEEAAYTLGSSRWATFRRVILPEIWPGLLYGIVLTFARSLGEFGAVAVVGGSVQNLSETATLYVYRALHDRNPIGAYGVSVALGLLSVGILIVMSRHRPQRKIEGKYVNSAG